MGVGEVGFIIGVMVRVVGEVMVGVIVIEAALTDPSCLWKNFGFCELAARLKSLVNLESECLCEGLGDAGKERDDARDWMVDDDCGVFGSWTGFDCC